MRDLTHKIGAFTAVSPRAITTTAVVGSIIDLLGFNSAAFAITSGTITDGTYAVTLTEGNDPALADGVAATATEILGTLPSFALTDDNVTKRFGYSGINRYVRVTITPTGATTGGLFSAVAILGEPNSAPVA